VPKKNPLDALTWGITGIDVTKDGIPIPPVRSSLSTDDKPIGKKPPTKVKIDYSHLYVGQDAQILKNTQIR